MTVTLPDAHLVASALKRQAHDDQWQRALNTVSNFPELCRDNNILQEILLALGATYAAGIRQSAARILHDIGHPEGLRHLVFNSLSVHPTLNVRQTNFDTVVRARSALLSTASKLPESLLDLIIQDVRNPKGNLHADTLAFLTDDGVVPLLRTLLEEPERTAVQAAYALAIKGDDDGRTLLKNVLEVGRYIEVAIVALTHVPRSIESQRALNRFQKRIAEEPVRLITSGAENAIQSYVDALATISRCKENRQIDTLLVGYQKPAKSFVSEINVPDVSLICVHSTGHGFEPRLPDLLADLASPHQRVELVSRQRLALAMLADAGAFDEANLGLLTSAFWHDVMPNPLVQPLAKHVLLQSVRITLELPDYFYSGTNWIVSPERSRKGMAGGAIAQFLGHDLY